MSTLLDNVRAKYPAYADKPDDELALAIANKYPVYLTRDEEFAKQVASFQPKPNALQQAQLDTGMVNPSSDRNQGEATSPSERAAAAEGAGLNLAKNTVMLPLEVLGAVGKTAYAAAADLSAWNDDDWAGRGGNFQALFNGKGGKLPVEKFIATAAKDAPKLAVAANVAKEMPGVAAQLGINPTGIVGRLMAGAFSADMLIHAKPLMDDYAEEINKPEAEQDAGKLAELRAGLLQTAIFAPLTAAHAATGGAPAAAGDAAIPSPPRPAGRGQGEVSIPPPETLKGGSHEVTTPGTAAAGPTPDPVPEPPAKIIDAQSARAVIPNPDPDGLGAKERINRKVASGTSREQAVEEVKSENDKADSWIGENTKGGDVVQTPDGRIRWKDPVSGDWLDVTELGVRQTLLSGRPSSALGGGKIIRRGLKMREADGLANKFVRHERNGVEFHTFEDGAPDPVPEPLSTLQAQITATLDPNSAKKATLITPGAAMPEVPAGLQSLPTKAGTFLFNPAKVSAAEVRDAYTADAYGTLLGMSTETKPGTGGTSYTSPQPTAVLQTKNADGVPVQEEVITPDTAPSAIAAGQAVTPKGTQEIKSPEQVIAERQAAPASPDVQKVTPRHLKEARSILDAERTPDVLDEIGDHFGGVKIPETPDFDWARERIKALRTSKAADLSKNTLKSLFQGNEPIDNVVTALNGVRTSEKYGSTDKLLEAMLNAAESRVGAKDSHRPEVRQLAEQIAAAESQPSTLNSQPSTDAITDWDQAAAAVRADLANMSGTALNASKGPLATHFPVLNAKAGFVPPKFEIQKPIKGPTGAMIVGYEWRSKMGEKWSNREGGYVEARVSDWDNSDTSKGTGRDIVHVFYVLHPDGKTTVEGVRSAQNVLGINETRLMTIAKNERAAQNYRAQQVKAEAEIWEKAAKDNPPDAARDYRTRNHSSFRTFEENDAMFRESVLFEKGGKFVRRPPKATEFMENQGWKRVENDPAKPGTMSGTSLNASKGPMATHFPALAASMVDVKPMESPEILRLTRDAFGSEVAARKLSAGIRGYAKANNIALSDNLFADPKAVAMVLAHEIGHVNDFMPEGTLKRGNLIGRLIGSTKKFMLGQEGWIKDKKLREELIDLSAYWRPWDRTTAKDSFRQYRDSAKELYADAISVLLNSPGLLQQRAPTFFKAFFDKLDAKPQFKEEFFALQDLINRGPEALLEARSAQSREAFERGEALLHEKIAFKQAARNSFKDFFTKIKIQTLDIAAAARKKLGSKDPANPSEVDRLYEEWKMADNRNAADVQRIYQEMIKPVLATGLDEHTFGQVLELQRIAGNTAAYQNMQAMRTALGPAKMDVLRAASDKLADLDRKGLASSPAAGRIASGLSAAGIPFDYVEIFRQLRESQGTRAELANDQARSPLMAEAELNHLLDGATPAQRAALLDAAAKFRSLMFERVTEAKDVGIINDTAYEHTIVPNKDTYAAFRPVDKIDTYVSPVVRRAKGSLGDIENPFITTLLKLTSVNNLIELQKLKNSVRDEMGRLFPGEFVPAETRWNGRHHEAYPKPPKDSNIVRVKRDGQMVDMARLEIMENGRNVGYDVDPYIAKMFDQLTPEDSFWLNKLLSIPFRLGVYPLIIKYNPGFLFAFNPKRDLARTTRNLYAVEGVTRRELLPNYADKKVLQAVNDYLHGRPNPLADAMIKHKAIGGSWEGFAQAESGDVMTDLLRQYKLAAEPQRNAAKRALLWLPSKLNQGGAFLEALPKFASYKTLIERGLGPERAAYLVRNYAGTPNFKVKGQHAKVLNSYLPFINIFLQGWRSDLKLATNPKTAGGWWMQWMLQHGWQATLVGLASAGVFGDDIKKRFAAISEYDKTNYGIIPLGSSSTGDFMDKTFYLRTPRDETSRFFSALTYKATRAIADKLMGNPSRPDSLGTEAFAFGAGVLPSPTPLLDIAGAWKDYASGQNPVDSFRNQPIIRPNNYKAGGTAGLGDMFQWTLNQAGVLSLVKYDPNANTTTEVVVGAMPIANRLLKFSDQGHREDQMNSERLDEQGKAKLRIQYNDDVRTLLARHAWLQKLGQEKRTPEQDRIWSELHNWKTTTYDREDAAAWDQKDTPATQRPTIDALNRNATRTLKFIKAPADTVYGPAR